jgi:hypothetical protein
MGYARPIRNVRRSLYNKLGLVNLQEYAAKILEEKQVMDLCMAQARTNSRKPAEQKAREYAQDCMRIFNEMGLLETRSMYAQ